LIFLAPYARKGKEEVVKKPAHPTFQVGWLGANSTNEEGFDTAAVLAVNWSLLQRTEFTNLSVCGNCSTIKV